MWMCVSTNYAFFVFMMFLCLHRIGHIRMKKNDQQRSQWICMASSCSQPDDLGNTRKQTHSNQRQQNNTDMLSLLNDVNVHIAIASFVVFCGVHFKRTECVHDQAHHYAQSHSREHYNTRQQQQQQIPNHKKHNFLLCHNFTALIEDGLEVMATNGREWNTRNKKTNMYI